MQIDPTSLLTKLMLLVSILFALAGCATVPVSPASRPTAPPAASPTAALAAAAATSRMVIPIAATTVRVGQHRYSAQVQVKTANEVTRTVRVNYLLYLPGRYGQDRRQKWPLILFLHGKDQRGSDLNLLKKHPLPKILAQQTDFPAIVLSPQLPVDDRWWTNMIEPVKILLDRIQSSYSVDPRRVYLTGLSMGGFGTWNFALRYPERFAAVVPIAGGYLKGSDAIPENICSLSDLPIWVFHGDSDTIVRPYQSKILVEALKACGGNVRLTLYPGVGHEGAWTRAYADPELYQWLFAQTIEDGPD